MISFSHYRFAVERAPLARPFHFKGGFFTEKWINVVRLLQESDGDRAPAPVSLSPVGIGGNAVLWSDPDVFRQWSEFGGNALMSLLAEQAVQLARGWAFAHPIEAFEQIRPRLQEFGRQLTGHSQLSGTFTLNAMVALDFALWRLYAGEQGAENLHDLLPDLSGRRFAGSQPSGSDGPFAKTDRAAEGTGSLLRVPLISYNVPVSEVLELVNDGHRILKIKLGHGGDPAQMVERDAERLQEIHAAMSRTNHTVRYYLDANGRYPDMDTLQRLLERVDRIGALESCIILEEPFPYDTHIAVDGLPVRVAADESLHNVEDLTERIQLGYGALALKPAGKTLSLSALMARRAAEFGIPCFVADSACVPSLLQWNLAFAALLPPFPGFNMRFMESNGSQNYANWHDLIAEHSESVQRWLTVERGAFHLDRAFEKCSGGIFSDTDHYGSLVGASH